MFTLNNIKDLVNFDPFNATIQLLCSNSFSSHGVHYLTTTIAELIYDWCDKCNVCPCNDDYVYIATIYVEEENNKPYPIIGLSDFEELAQTLYDDWWKPYTTEMM